VALRYPLAILAVINILYGAFCSLAQKDIKRMVAYSSVNHMGYVLLGIASFSVIGINGAVLQMVSHGIITAALFLLIGVLYDRTHTREMDAFGGLGSPMPVLTGFMTIACLASLGLPFFSGFVSELLCFVGAFSAPALRVLTGVSLIGILITAVFFLVMLRKVFMGALNAKWENLTDMTPRELATTSPLLLLTLALGIWPGLLLFPIGATMTHVVELLKLP
jgi:NADH-quinone oxidoreductase subunit M